MFRFRFSPNSFVIGLVVTTILAIALTLAVVAQAPDNGEPASPAPEPATAVEEERVSAPAQTTQGENPDGNGEAGGPVDSITVVEEVELLPGATSPGLTQFFKFISANVFVPYDDDMTYNYGGAGCVYRTGGASFTEHTLQLPEGAEIDYLRVYFYDADATNDALAFLFSFDGAGNFTEIARAESSGTPGQSSSGSGFFSYFVDNTSSALALRLSFENGSNSNLKICGVRLRYQYNLSSVSLPVLLNNANP